MDNNDANIISQNISFFANQSFKSFSFYDLYNPLLFNQNDLYQLVQNPDDMVKISDERPLPNIVLNAIEPFTARVYLGILSFISKFYCIIDNSVYFWSTDSIGGNDRVEFYVEEESTIISCVSCGQINVDVINKKECIGIIVYGTDILMKIVPVTKNEICFDLSFVIKMKFIPSDFYIEKSGTIYISSSEGDIYSLTYSFDDTGRKSTNLTNLTSYNFIQKLMNNFFDSSPIIKIAIDEETQIFASLNSNSIINFYKLNGDKMDFISKYDPFESECNCSIKQISNIPLNYSNRIKFVGFFEDGSRIYFDVDDLDLVNPSIIRPPPIECSNGNVFFNAFLFPSYCIFLYEKSIVIARDEHKSNGPNNKSLESFCVIPLSYDVLSFSQKIPNIPITKMVNNPFYWQHLFSPPTAFLITTNGFRTLNFLTPLDKLTKLFNEEKKAHIFMSEPLVEWCSIDILETTATSLILAEKLPEYKYRCLQFIMKAIQNAEHNQNELEPRAIYSFYIRLSRILDLIWFIPLFQKKSINENEFYEINEGFKKAPINYVNEIQFLKSLCDDYHGIFIRTNQPKTEDIDQFPLLSKFLTKLIGILQFIDIIMSLDTNTINQVIAKMDVYQSNRLVLFPFGYSKNILQSYSVTQDPTFTRLSQYYQNVSLIQSFDDAFHDFSMKLYEVMPNSDALKKIENDCPQFYSRCDINILNAIKSIKEKFDNTDGSITSNVNILIQYISRPMNLEEICKILKEKGCFDLAYKLCIAKADSVDPLKLALHWFHFDTDKPNSPGSDEFDNRYQYYQIIFNQVDIDHNDNIDPILSSDDEMLHICFYYHLHENRQIKKIFSRKIKYPFLKDFVRKIAPQYLWRYLAANKKYLEACFELLKYFKDDDDHEIDLEKRIKYLKKGLLYSCENARLQNEFKLLLDLGQIQLELKYRTNNEDDYGNYIFKPKDLYIECVCLKMWDLTLRICSIYPFQAKQKKFAISQVWQNFFMQDLFNLDLLECTTRLIHLLSCLNLNSEAAKIDTIVPLFENFRISKKGQIYWAINIFIKVGYHISNLAKVYYFLSQDEFAKIEVKCSFIDVFSFALVKGAFFDKDKALALKNWFTENGNDYERFQFVIQNFNSFLC